MANVRYSADSLSMPSASADWRWIMSWAATSAPSLRKHPGQNLLDSYRFECLVVGGLGVRVVVGVDVEAVGCPTSRGHDVEHFAGGRR